MARCVTVCVRVCRRTSIWKIPKLIFIEASLYRSLGVLNLLSSSFATNSCVQGPIEVKASCWECWWTRFLFEHPAKRWVSFADLFTWLRGTPYRVRRLDITFARGTPSFSKLRCFFPALFMLFIACTSNDWFSGYAEFRSFHFGWSSQIIFL